MVINGGGAYRIQVDHASFIASDIYLTVPCNEFVIAPTVILRTSSQPKLVASDSACELSKYQFPDVAILPSTVKTFAQGDCNERGSIIPEAQVSVILF